jgi:hypothetical protein
MHDPISTPHPKGGLLPFRRPVSQPVKMRQIDIGDYILFVGNLQVGEVYVEPSAEHPDDPAHTVEHWCLYADYEAPGPERTDVSLELRYRRQSPYDDATKFLEHVATIPGARYVRACCAQIALAKPAGR